MKLSSSKASMPNPEKKNELEATNYRGWKAMPYVIGNETFEKLGTIGTSSNLLVYLKTVFNMKSITAATLISVWSGTTNIATVFGAFLSDAYFGRYKTLGFASISSFLGMLMLTQTAVFSKLHPRHCPSASTDTTHCEKSTKWQLAFLLGSLGFLVVGAGGIRPCNLAFGADQFNPKTESGKRGINSFFNWFYFTFTFAMMISSTLIIYVQSNISWAIGLAIPAGLMFLSCSFFFIGSPIYVKVQPEGSPFTGAIQVLVASIRKRRANLPTYVDGGGSKYFNPKFESGVLSKLQHTDQFRFLDKAALILDPKEEINEDGLARDPWRLCTMQKVEELKCVVRILPIWFSAMLFNITIVTQKTYVVFQALQSDRKLSANHSFTIPAASFIVFMMATLSIFIPIYDRLAVPFLRRMTHKEQGISLLQRIGIGIFLSVGVMILSGVVESRRRLLLSSMSGMWLVPQLALAGISEGFTLIGQTEFYYKEFPENMRSVAGAFFFSNHAVSDYVVGFLITLVHRVTAGGGKESWLAENLNNGRLDYYYYLIATIAVFNLIFFLVVSHWYRYKSKDDGVDTMEFALQESNGANGHAC